MRLFIDAQALQTPTSRFRGIGRYTRNLIVALTKVRPDWQLSLLENTALPAIDRSRIPEVEICPFTPPAAMLRENRPLNECYLADWIAGQCPDVVLLPSVFEDLALIPRFHSVHPLCVGVLYDLIPLVWGREYLGKTAMLEWYPRRLRQLLRCDGVLAISEASADDLRRFCQGNHPEVVNIAGAAEEFFSQDDPESHQMRMQQLRHRYELSRDYILYVGGIDDRKNLRGALRAFAELPPKLRAKLDLVIVCNLDGKQWPQLQNEVNSLGITGHVKLIGFVEDAELRALYHDCRLFFFPSLYEGLGLPILEALHCGAPVVASNCSSLPEYCGAVAWLVDPHSPKSMALGLQAALAEDRDRRLRQRLEHARQFTWQNTAERAAQTIEKLYQRGRSISPSRPRLAWLAPAPSVSSNERTVMEHWAEQLSASFEIIWCIDPRQPLISPTFARCWRGILWNEIDAYSENHPFDLFVYWTESRSDRNDLGKIASRHPGWWIESTDKKVYSMRWSEPPIKLLVGADQEGEFVQPHKADAPVPAILVKRLWEAIQQRRICDGAWIDTVRRAVADAVGPLPTRLPEQWAELRWQVLRQKVHAAERIDGSAPRRRSA